MTLLSDSPVIPIKMPVRFEVRILLATATKGWRWGPMKWWKFCIRITWKSPLLTVVWNDECGPQMAMLLLSDSPVIPIMMPVRFEVRILPATAAKGWRWVANEMVEILHKNYMEPPPLHTVVWNDGCGPQMAMPLLSNSPVIPIRMPVQFEVSILPATAAKGWRRVANEMVEILHKNYMEPSLHTVVWNDGCRPQMAMPLLSNSPVMSTRKHVRYGVEISKD